MSDQFNNAWISPRDFSIQWGGRELKIKTGLVAQQAGGSALVQYADTVVLVTVTMASESRGEIDYFPLMVDHEERLYAAGIIKGSRFIKRETRPTTEAVLTARLVDRSIRPLFDESVRLDVQVVTTVLSVDGENDADVPSLIGAVASLVSSDIPWEGPICGVKVGRVAGELILNPTYAQLAESDFDIFIAGNGESTIMLEAGAKEVSEADVFQAIQFGLKGMKPVMDLLVEIQKQLAPEKRTMKKEDLSEEEIVAKAEIEELKQFVSGLVEEKVKAYFDAGPDSSKKLRKQTLKTIKDELEQALKEKQVGKDRRKAVLKDFKVMMEHHIGEMILSTGKRVDGRSVTDVRPLDIMVGLLPRTHGSALFTRGETQVMTIATLAGPGAALIQEGIAVNGEKSYMHHYNFPGFSVGEVKPLRGPSRRDLGHGALAEKALIPVIPSKEEFPYTIRLVSEVLGSNGSSSMASACGSTLALMNAGVPIKAPVAGVAMGLISNKKGDWVVLTDLQDLEDAEGGMDFKVTGTKNGITAIQLDTKTHGLSSEIIEKTLIQSKAGIQHILDAMTSVIPVPSEMSQYAPRVETITINPDKIRDVIGPGGKIINKIIEETGVEIDIEQDGSVFISSADKEGMAKAREWINNLTREVKAGEEFEGTVTRLMDFGAFVEILPGQEGLVHISEIAYERTNAVADVLKVGQKVKVKVKEIDDQNRINLSMKALLPKPEGYVEEPRQPRSPRRDSRSSRGPRR